MRIIVHDQDQSLYVLHDLKQAHLMVLFMIAMAVVQYCDYDHSSALFTRLDSQEL